jgi:hypothetical protein
MSKVGCGCPVSAEPVTKGAAERTVAQADAVACRRGAVWRVVVKKYGDSRPDFRM